MKLKTIQQGVDQRSKRIEGAGPKVALLGGAVSLTLAMPAFAADQPGIVSNEPILPEVIVTSQRPVRYTEGQTRSATRSVTALQDVPQSVTIVTKTAMDDAGMQSMADVLQYVPGAGMAQGESHRDNPILRGNASSADFFVNGLRDDAQYKRDLYNLERVEVLKGPNAMIFGRGGGGGVVNSVTKEAGWTPTRELMVRGGSFGTKRVAADVGQALTETVAFRLNAVYEEADSYRDSVTLERYGINPTVTIAPNENTRLKLGYEYFQDKRTVDRGVPSFNGRPANTNRSTFFGNPDASSWDATKNAATAIVEHETAAGYRLRNSTIYSDVDKFYQNVYPSSGVSAAGMLELGAYNNRTPRKNFINQTDLSKTFEMGTVKHTVLVGIELSRQKSEGLRKTGYFNDSATRITVPASNPTDYTPVTFRQGATDADGRTTVGVMALYAQNQIEFSGVQAILGLRYDNFQIDYHNNRTNSDLNRDDGLLSPRIGFVVKPQDALSLYTSYSVSYLPYSGDQFTSLDATTQTLEPEKFSNYEIGAKWAVSPQLNVSSALYRLDRTNTRATDPNNAALTVQTGRTRTTGFELNLQGDVTAAWQITGGYAYQDAKITSAISAAPAGARVALVPYHTLSLWNKYRFTRAWGAGVGLIYNDDSYAAVDNKVQLPSYTRTDAALFYTFERGIKAQLNVENVFNRQYFPTANGNNNITPGAPRAVYLTLNASF